MKFELSEADGGKRGGGGEEGEEEEEEEKEKEKEGGKATEINETEGEIAVSLPGGRQLAKGDGRLNVSMG